MLLHERTRAAERQRTAGQLLDIADQISSTKHLTQAAFLATSDMPLEYGNPIGTLLCVIRDRLEQVAETLSAVSNGEASDAA